MQRLRAIHYGIGNQLAVERRQLPAMGRSQRQQIAVCHLPRLQQARSVHVPPVK